MPHCPICGHRFETEESLDAHVPCPEDGTEWAPTPLERPPRRRRSRAPSTAPTGSLSFGEREVLGALRTDESLSLAALSRSVGIEAGHPDAEHKVAAFAGRLTRRGLAKTTMGHRTTRYWRTR